MRTSILTHAALVLCIAALAAITANCFPMEKKGAGGRKDGRVQFASWDDVNVLAHGLLQLGQGLKEHVDKTKGQVREISARLRAFDGTVAKLGQQTQRLEREGAEMRSHEARVLNASAELRERAEELRKESQGVGDRMTRLEEKVDGMLQRKGMEVTNGNYSDPRIVQWMLEVQNKRIDDLVERIRHQQDKLEKQSVRIRTLRNQIQLKKERSFLRRKVEEDIQNGTSEQSDSPMKKASDCHQLFLDGERSSGVYTLQPAGSQPFQVFCEMTSEGGWTVIQRRQDGSVDFDQEWLAYRDGFGNLKGEFWLGLEKAHSIVKDRAYVLQVALSDWKDAIQSDYYVFHLDGEEKAYALHLQDTATGGLGTLSTEPSGLPFSTRDHDNDQQVDTNCAKLLSGGWWFGGCEHSNLNGRYFPGHPPKPRHLWKQGMFWKTWRGRSHLLKTTVIKIAPAEIQRSL